ncbi:MAG: Gfo/Idh/MocA family oxidoreductase [Solirubrobacterales bacterium]|nr:Gfo/Idh/MocA family oxidoreductase [Solirubrobacterales bacterium]
MQTLRTACFGAGWVTTNRHIPAMRAQGGFEIEAIVDRSGDRAREAAERLGVPRHAEASSVDELDFADELDAVTCGTAPFAHHEVVGSALRAGKHTITEKPFTMTLAEGEELASLAEERERALCVVHNFQFSRSVRTALGWLESGALGAVRGIWAMQLSNPQRRLPDWYDELPLGLFYDESPHLIYVARALAGCELEPLTATVRPSSHGLRTPAQIDLALRGGEVPVTMVMNFEAPVSEWHVAVLGERSLAVVDLFRDTAVRLPNDQGHGALNVLRSSLAGTGRHWLGYLRSGPRHLAGRLRYGNEEVFSRFHGAATGAGPAAGIGVEDALAVLRLQQWAVQAGEARR